MALNTISADVAGGSKALGLEAAGESLKAHDQVLYQAAIVLSESLEHLNPVTNGRILMFSFDL
jgi:hypothetical protein